MVMVKRRGTQVKVRRLIHVQRNGMFFVLTDGVQLEPEREKLALRLIYKKYCLLIMVNLSGEIIIMDLVNHEDDEFVSPHKLSIGIGISVSDLFVGCISLLNQKISVFFTLQIFIYCSGLVNSFLFDSYIQGHALDPLRLPNGLQLVISNVPVTFSVSGIPSGLSNIKTHQNYLEGGYQCCI
ncbi:hypothetical protein T4E_9876 [Trichinella pseudospiralis]|uniref:Uncharacterized protein n=1 Tax=Trichinella pseudospiralis TaxID=6337 RepID=A0A0V0XPX0_TRIPS|nr:hypothetical protein T4E_9876 [Trichinella pseudospiralis]